MQNLVIDGIIHQIDASFSLRWVEQENGQPYPVLYKNGKRVYGGTRKKIRKIIELDDRIKDILNKMRDLRDEQW